MILLDPVPVPKLFVQIWIRIKKILDQKVNLDLNLKNPSGIEGQSYMYNYY